jgi:hypothetical protein
MCFKLFCYKLFCLYKELLTYDYFRSSVFKHHLVSTFKVMNVIILFQLKCKDISFSWKL